ncbi:hypothetical protein [Parapedobacter tibetensis]|uniref:hypothetical protein n=1 Tax=Parapedobacter tibetensis TaxID=2972951 RepID=UPI002152918E|nr:hypothetical protein [Parapedobacter tibetensis]
MEPFAFQLGSGTFHPGPVILRLVYFRHGHGTVRIPVGFGYMSPQYRPYSARLVSYMAMESFAFQMGSGTFHPGPVILRLVYFRHGLGTVRIPVGFGYMSPRPGNTSTGLLPTWPWNRSHSSWVRVHFTPIPSVLRTACFQHGHGIVRVPDGFRYISPRPGNTPDGLLPAFP